MIPPSENHVWTGTQIRSSQVLSEINSSQLSSFVPESASLCCVGARGGGGGAEWRSCARAFPLHTSPVDSRFCCSLGNFPILSLAHSIFPIFTPSRIGRTQIVFSFRVPSHYKCRPLRSTQRNAAHCVRLGRPFVVVTEGGTGIRSYLFSFRSTLLVSYPGTERGALSQCQP